MHNQNLVIYSWTRNRILPVWISPEIENVNTKHRCKTFQQWIILHLYVFSFRVQCIGQQVKLKTSFLITLSERNLCL